MRVSEYIGSSDLVNRRMILIRALSGAWAILVKNPLSTLVVIASITRLPNLGQESLWYDETFTAWVSKLPFDRFWVAIQGDVHPPLYYLLEWVNMRLLGDGEIALRIPSAVFGIFAVLLVWRIAVALKQTPSVALLAGVIVALMPTMIYYSQEARMYTLLMVFVLGALLAAIRGKWLIFVLCGVGACYTQNLGVFSIAALCFTVLGHYTYRVLSIRPIYGYKLSNLARVIKKPLIASIAIALLWLPWLLGVEIHQAAAMGQGFWLQPLNPGAAIEPVFAMTASDRAAPAILFAAYAVTGALTLASLISSRLWLVRDGLYLVGLLLLAPALMIIVSVVWRSIYLPRVLIAQAALLSIPWAYALLNMKPENRQIAWLAFAPLGIAVLIGYYFPAGGAREPWAQMLAPVQSQFQPGDVVYYGSINVAINDQYFLRDLPYALRHEGTDLNQGLSPVTETAFGFNEVEFKDLAAQGYKRAWLIDDLNPMSSDAEVSYLNQILATYPSRVYEDFNVSPYSTDQIYIVNLTR